LNNAATEVLKALDAGAQQVIYFAQDKVFLRRLQDKLIELDPDRLETGNVHILDASVPGWRRKKLVEPAVRDKAKVFLMTSSGARGVSFPKTDWILASVPRFNIEAGLMEIAQLIYRGRGRYNNEHGELVSGDSVPRHLVMLVDDYLVADKKDARQWLRQSLDLMTLLIMLRSTILTRITGDSDLRQKLALVPVGAVGVDELINLMSQYVSQFMREAERNYRPSPVGRRATWPTSSRARSCMAWPSAAPMGAHWSSPTASASSRIWSRTDCHQCSSQPIQERACPTTSASPARRLSSRGPTSRSRKSSPLKVMRPRSAGPPEA
jgi:hypothetical protein